MESPAYNKEEAIQLCSDSSTHSIKKMTRRPKRSQIQKDSSEEDSRETQPSSSFSTNCNRKRKNSFSTPKSRSESSGMNSSENELSHTSTNTQIQIYSVSKSTEEDSKETQRNSTASTNCNRKRKNPFSTPKSGSERSGMNSSENELSHTSYTSVNTSKKSSKTTKDIGVQTLKSFLSHRSRMFCSFNPDIDETLPFAMVIIWDGTFKIAKKIVLSNINADETFPSQ